MLFNRLLTANWLPGIKIEMGGRGVMKKCAKKGGGREVEVKTHEIGIGSFASVMINGEREAVRAEEEGERWRGFFFL